MNMQLALRRGATRGRSLALVLCLGVLSISAMAGDLITDGLEVRHNAMFYGDLRVEGTGAIDRTNDWIVYYSFDTNTVPIPDDSGNGNTGTLNNATWVTNGLSGGGYEFDNDDDSVYPPMDAFPGNIFSSATVAVWVNLDSMSSSDYIYYMAGPANDPSMMVQTVNSSGQLRWRSWGAGGAEQWDIYSTENVSAGEWTHIAVAWTTNSALLYINGERACTEDTSCELATCGQLVYHKFGDDSAGTSTADGIFDDARIYNRQLSADEINDLYELGIYAASSSVRFEDGIDYSSPLGDVSMGSYTNQ